MTSARRTRTPKSKAKSTRMIATCKMCDHPKARHTMAGCLGDGGPGANCACDDFVRVVE